ncbi:MAG: hypothetical protein WKF73_02040 [Nocardioidaceae bacterium]
MRDALNAGDYNLRWMGAAFLPVEWVRLKLDLEAFDDAQFEPYLQRCRHAGLDFINMAELGDTTAHRRALYELNKTCSADIPDRGTFYTFEDYLAERIYAPSYDPRVWSSRWTRPRGLAWPRRRFDEQRATRSAR